MSRSKIAEHESHHPTLAVSSIASLQPRPAVWGWVSPSIPQASNLTADGSGYPRRGGVLPFSASHWQQTNLKADVRERTKDNPIVYIVDDDEDVREGLKSIFSSVGLRVEAFSGTTALLTSKVTEEVSCLVLDVRLPGLSGLDFQAELVKAGIKIPIVFITGYGDVPMSVKAMKAGAIEFLTKPVREQDLLDAVRVALDRDRARRDQNNSDHDLRTRYNGLTNREQQVMRYVCAGLMNKQSAAEIGISEITVKVHRHNVMRKLGAKSLADLVRMAERLGVPQK